MEVGELSVNSAVHSSEVGTLVPRENSDGTNRSAAGVKRALTNEHCLLIACLLE